MKIEWGNITDNILIGIGAVLFLIGIGVIAIHQFKWKLPLPWGGEFTIEGTIQAGGLTCVAGIIVVLIGLGLKIAKGPPIVVPKLIIGVIGIGVILIIIIIGVRYYDYHRLIEERKRLNLVTVEKGSYNISAYIKQYTKKYNIKSNSILIERPFAIQAHEVTVGEFRRYANALSADKRKQLGTRWEQEDNGKQYPDERPVENITWQEVVAYAAWLSEKTRLKLRLPTVDEWITACEKYAEPFPVTQTPDDQPKTISQGNKHLLGNLREWSSTPCYAGYYLLGENYMTDKEIIGAGYCEEDNEKWLGVGFRLVVEE